MKEIGLFPVKSGVVLLADFYFHIESSKLRKGVCIEQDNAFSTHLK